MKDKLLIPFCFLFFAACNNSEEIKRFPDLEDKYDPSQPKVVNSISPLVGRVDDNFVLEGNFGRDISKMKVYFGERKALLLKTNGQTIHGIIPKLSAGENPITVVLEEDSIVTNLKFRYRQFQNVVTITGSWEKREDWGIGEFKDGPLDQATFVDISGITVVAGGNLIVGETSHRRLRFVSIEDNEVVRISGDWGPAFDQGATISTRETAYFIESGSGSHNLYRLDRSNAWDPVQIRSNIPELTGDVHSSTFADNDQYMYVCDNHGNFGRIDVKNRGNKYPFELLKLDKSIKEMNKLCYSKFSDCFYATAPADHVIYKIWEDKAAQQWKIDLYAGSPRKPGYSEGHRKDDAKFSFPTGICADNYGNVFVTNQTNHTIFKIWLRTERVEHVAGLYKEGWIQKPVIVGKPLESQFLGPSCIAMDEEENFFIGSSGGHEIYKYSIE